ncbi:hypothetical protein [Actinomadura violacea]|uniref:Uncharacterized protein n=1 Tax=Actinomadura violacea TaxID=2819934 RepID=A0ABS3RRZ8_9ACTN|nr:hypothetical protein [Actinomadura violacea]MBO2459493.1 hypothetical protein [Actinomadura violacea]
MAQEDELRFVVDSDNVDAPAAEEISEELFSLDQEVDQDASGPDSPQDADRLVQAREALRGGKPIFLVQRSHQHSAIIPTLLQEVSSRHTDTLSLGVVAPMPRMRPKGPSSVENFFRNTAATAPIQIADPECFARLDSYGDTLKAQRDDKPYVGNSTASKWDYFNRPLSAGWEPEWVAEVVETQRAQGATVLLTPGLWMDPAERVQSLSVLRDTVNWSRQTISSQENLAVNVTIPSSWLTTERLREYLLAEMLDLDEDVFYVRVRWPLLSQPYGQMIVPEILDGYMELAAVCEENDKVLILPNTSMTGWLSLAWGANGFSTGIGSGERAFADTKVIKIKRTTPRPAPTNRTFNTSLLHVVDLQTERLLADLPDYRACQCEFCRTQIPGTWDKGKAGAHYLQAVADTIASSSRHPRGARAGSRSVVRQALAFKEAADPPVPLEGANAPKHLDVWFARL